MVIKDLAYTNHELDVNAFGQGIAIVGAIINEVYYKERYGIDAIDALMRKSTLKVEAWLRRGPKPPRRQILLSPKSMAYHTCSNVCAIQRQVLQMGKPWHLVYCNGRKEEVGLTMLWK
jgi:hypothetical protein